MGRKKKLHTYISIHAPRVGSDERRRTAEDKMQVFQSTLPVWGATDNLGVAMNATTLISIHAPRVGSDPHSLTSHAFIVYFNPRSPCGERPSIT